MLETNTADDVVYCDGKINVLFPSSTVGSLFTTRTDFCFTNKMISLMQAIEESHVGKRCNFAKNATKKCLRSNLIESYMTLSERASDDDHADAMLDSVRY
jgi:hypothetical protein